MLKRTKLLIATVSLAAVLALSVGGIAAASIVDNTNYGDNVCRQGTGFGQEVCTEAVSKLLGMTIEQIQEQRHSGYSLVQIAAIKR